MADTEALGALSQIVADLTRDLPPKARYQRQLEALMHCFPCDACAILRLNGDTLIPLAVRGLNPDTLGRRFHLPEQPRLEQLVQSRGIVRFPADLPLPDPYDGLFDTPDHHIYVHDCIGAPLHVDGRTWGVVTMDAQRAGSFDAIDLKLLETFVAVIAASIRAAELITALESDLERHQLVQQSWLAPTPESELLGESPQMQRLRHEAEVVGRSGLPVLIQGETGTGKELVAREIFRQSLRSDKPFITLNCAALPAELIESELFGHVKGAFTGAVQAREGRFLLADKGTLFLDEIGELPLALQAKLLRVVQYGEFEQVGSSFTRRVNVRIIAATHRDLKKEVAAGKFREDLYYRLHVFPLYLPPLRERGNDILLLAEAFLAKYAARYGRPQPTLSEADKQQLLHYHWPGNVRELQNIMERAVITSREGSIQLTGITASEASSTHNPAMPEKILTAAQLEQLERENMERALRATKGKVFGADGAAALIGIPPTTLSSRMKKLGIHLNRFK